MKNITFNKVKIDLSDADVSIQDHNDMTDSDEFLPMVEVVVNLGNHGFVYQTDTTYDHGMSSQIVINRESGAFDSVQALLEELGAYDENHDDPDEQVYEVGKMIGDALEVQKVFDAYMSEHGTWERGNGMDANTEIFVTDKA